MADGLILFFTDTDECANAADNNCDVNAVCTDTTESYTCACNPGYTGDGILCSGENNIFCNI